MIALVTYDITEGPRNLYESKHTQVKNAMKNLGYSDKFIVGQNQTPVYYLPNTSLWKADTTPTQAKSDLLNVARQCNAEVERLIATQFDNWDGIPGKPYSG